MLGTVGAIFMFVGLVCFLISGLCMVMLLMQFFRVKGNLSSEERTTAILASFIILLFPKADTESQQKTANLNRFQFMLFGLVGFVLFISGGLMSGKF